MSDKLLQAWMNSGQTIVPNVLLTHYRKIGLTNGQFILILELWAHHSREQTFPDIEKIASAVGADPSQIYEELDHLLKNQYLSMETVKDASGKQQEIINFDLLWERLAKQLTAKLNLAEEQSRSISTHQLFQMFEDEFGRPLSPIELETLKMWLDEDQYDPELIQLALREAVLNQVYNFKYIDRILLSWEKKNIKTKEQVLKESKAYKNHRQIEKSSQQKSQSNREVPLFNWIDDKNRK